MTWSAHVLEARIQRLSEETNWHGTPIRRKNGDFIQVDSVLKMKGSYEVN